MTAFETTIPVSLVPGSKSMDREAALPPDGRAIPFGMNGGVSEHYGFTPETELPSTIDYLIASIGGCLIGTFAGSLRRAKVPVSPEALTATATGHVSSGDDGVLVLRKVVLNYTLELDDEHHAAAQEVAGAYANNCPNARSVMPAIEIETELELGSPVAA